MHQEPVVALLSSLQDSFQNCHGNLTFLSGLSRAN